MHELTFEFLGIEEVKGKDKTYYNIHLLNGFGSIKFYLSEEDKNILDQLKPKRLDKLVLSFDIVPVTYKDGNYNQTVFALKLKSIVKHIQNK